jgi:hypothetical protein
MGLFSTIFDLATLPVEIVKDVITLGGTITEEEESYTRKKMEEIDDDLKN